LADANLLGRLVAQDALGPALGFLNEEQGQGADNSVHFCWTWSSKWTVSKSEVDYFFPQTMKSPPFLLAPPLTFFSFGRLFSMHFLDNELTFDIG
jgi:hypothetical protein